MPRVAQSVAQLPLQPNVFLILLALADGPLHGYRLRSVVKDRSEGQVALDPGTLYRLIARLEAERLITPAAVPAAADRQDARRRYYRLTARGRSVLLAETERLRSLVRATDRLGRLRPEGGVSR